MVVIYNSFAISKLISRNIKIVINFALQKGIMNNKLLGVSELSKTPNPMEQSDRIYYQDLAKALEGLEMALERHSGNIGEVKIEDILAFSNIDPDVLKSLFTDANGLVKVIYKEMGALFLDVEKLLDSGLGSDAVLMSMFKKLKDKSPMLKIIFLLENYSIWRRSLKNITAFLAKGWPKSDTEEWKYLYCNFCCQFQSILEKWSTSEFAEERMRDCIRFVHIWLDADSMINEAAGDLLVDWSVQ